MFGLAVVERVSHLHSISIDSAIDEECDWAPSDSGTAVVSPLHEETSPTSSLSPQKHLTEPDVLQSAVEAIADTPLQVKTEIVGSPEPTMPAVATNGCKTATGGATATAVSVKGDVLKAGKSPQITLKNNQQMTCLSLSDMDCLKTPTVPDLLRTPTTLGSPTKSASCLAHADELNTPGLCFNSCTPKNHGQAFFGENEPLLTGTLLEEETFWSLSVPSFSFGTPS